MIGQLNAERLRHTQKVVEFCGRKEVLHLMKQFYGKKNIGMIKIFRLDILECVYVLRAKKNEIVLLNSFVFTVYIVDRFPGIDEKKFKNVMETRGTGCYNGSQSLTFYFIERAARPPERRRSQ